MHLLPWSSKKKFRGFDLLTREILLNGTKTTFRSSFCLGGGGEEKGLNVVLSLAEDGEDGEEVAEGEVDDDGDKDGAVDVHDAGLVQLLAREQHSVQQRHCLRTQGWEALNNLVRPSFNFGNNLPGSMTSALDGSVLEFINLVFAETSPQRAFSVTENEHFGLVFAKTGSINSGAGSGFSFSM
jgi:hypothetical protein